MHINVAMRYVCYHAVVVMTTTACHLSQLLLLMIFVAGSNERQDRVSIVDKKVRIYIHIIYMHGC